MRSIAVRFFEIDNLDLVNKAGHRDFVRLLKEPTNEPCPVCGEKYSSSYKLVGEGCSRVCGCFRCLNESREHDFARIQLLSTDLENAIEAKNNEAARGYYNELRTIERIIEITNGLDNKEWLTEFKEIHNILTKPDEILAKYRKK